MARPPLMRPGPTRVETYCSKVFLKVPCWRRSKDSTAGSCCTPPSAALTTLGEMPAACASADMFCTKLPKSPPQRAANAGAAPSSDATDNASAPSRARVRPFMCESLSSNLVGKSATNPLQIQNFKQLAHPTPSLRAPAKQSIEPQMMGHGLLPPTRKGASADSKPAIARIASDGGSSQALLA